MVHSDDLTTLRYRELWVFANPGKASSLKVSFEGVVKFYEHCWWAGVKLRPHLMAIEGIPTYVIPAEVALVCAVQLRERYAHLEEICQILELGLTHIRAA